MDVKTAAMSPKPTFFRVLLPGSLTKLLLPLTFGKKHIKREEVNGRGTRAAFLGPNGKRWGVTLHRDKQNSNIYFILEGWTECAEAYQLQHGYFLVFRYESHMLFSFTVYNLTTCEKLYPPTTPPLPRTVTSTYTAASANAAASVFTRTTRSQAQKNFNKKIKSCPAPPQPPQCGKKYDEKIKCPLALPPLPPPPPPLAAALPGFETTIKPSNLIYHYLTIPKEFVVASGITVRRKALTLKDEQNRLWPVAVYHKRRRRLGKSDINACLRGGWSGFARANKLKAGDRCCFQTEARGTGVLRFHVQLNT